MTESYSLLVVLGATASGKTALAVALARELGGEIISADSRQVYRGLDIGSGKDLQEYGAVAYHLIDIADPGCEFSVYDFQRHFVETYQQLNALGRVPILTGGSGLYLQAALAEQRMLEVPPDTLLRQQLAHCSDQQLVERLQQLCGQVHNSTDLLDRERTLRAIEIAQAQQRAVAAPMPVKQALVLGIQWPRPLLRERIARRLRQRLDQGLIDEVRRLQRGGLSWQQLDLLGLEYRFVAQHLRGEFNTNDLFQKLNAAIAQYAKRQDTWFRRMQRQGQLIHWLDGEGDLPAQAMALLAQYRYQPAD